MVNVATPLTASSEKPPEEHALAPGMSAPDVQGGEGGGGEGGGEGGEGGGEGGGKGGEIEDIDMHMDCLNDPEILRKNMAKGQTSKWLNHLDDVLINFGPPWAQIHVCTHLESRGRQLGLVPEKKNLRGVAVLKQLLTRHI